MKLIDIEELEEKINALQEYGIVGESNRAIVPYKDGDYYRVEDVKHMINMLKNE